MATTSIWRVNGWLGKVLIYIENPDKTENPDFFEKQDMDGKEFHEAYVESEVSICLLNSSPSSFSTDITHVK